MKLLIEAIRTSINTDNPLSALILAVNIPDICGKIENLGKTHYSDWYEDNIEKTYLKHISGIDAYAIRCALLHSFSTDLTAQKVHDVLEKFELTLGGTHLVTMSNCTKNGKLIPNLTIINPATYAQDMLNAYDKWLKNANTSLHIEIQKAESLAPTLILSGNIQGVVSYS